MQVVPANLILTSVSQKGQVTIPQEIRKKIGVKPKDKVAFRLEKGKLTVIPVGSPLDASFQAIPALKRKISLKEITRIATEEHAQHAASEGLKIKI